jgi:peptidoglycan/LPS O-acetylase OafA/YrhL
MIPFGREISMSPISRAAHVIAKYSYGIYLLHLPLLWIALVPFRAVPIAVQWLIFALLMIIVPWIAFQLIERPGIKLGQRLVQQPMPAATPVGAPYIASSAEPASWKAECVSASSRSSHSHFVHLRRCPFPPFTSYH